MTFAFKVKETLNTDANWLFLSATRAKCVLGRCCITTVGS